MTTATKPAHVRRRPVKANGKASGKLKPVDGPVLGQVDFDEWFATPIFETDSDERLEELATSRSRPARLAASTVLRVNARAAQVRTLVTAAAQPEEGGESAATALQVAERPSTPWRVRLSGALDRWADREMAAQVRLEAALTPRRWKA